jgi:hypothetical protein
MTLIKPWWFWLFYCLLIIPVAQAHGQGTPQTRLRPIVDWSTVRHVAMQRMDDGRLWRFDQPSPSHQAAVRVSIGGQGGSGSIIGTTGNSCVVLTNFHVVERGGRPAMALQCTTLAGDKFTGKYIGAHDRLDLAAYLVDRSDLPSLAVSSQDVPLGENVTVMAFGGPNHHKATFRPFVAPVIRGHAKVAVDAGTISGDSGSGMVWRGVLVGVNFGSVGGYSASEGGWPVHYPSSSWATAESINLFLTQCLNPYGCVPRVSPPGQPSSGSDGSPFYPPSQPASPPSLTPPQITQPQQPTQPAVPPAATCPPWTKEDIREIAMELRGPKGDPGPPGEVSEAHVQQIIASVILSLRSDPVMKGPQGERGADAVIDYDTLAAEVAKRLPPTRVVIADRASGKIIDDESYLIGEPIVLDFQNILRAQQAQ